MAAAPKDSPEEGAPKKATGGADGANVTPFRGARPCPICKKKATREFHPFCSKHCADVDLNRWLNGSYAIPAAEEPEEWSESNLPGDLPPEER